MAVPASDTKVRRFEGSVRVKGFSIAYVVWIPFTGNDFSNISLDPLSLTSHFEESIVCFHGWLDNANSFATPRARCA